ncbi:MAG: M23 family metallopeptidase [Ginsengibacter sp.]
MKFKAIMNHKPSLIIATFICFLLSTQLLPGCQSDNVPKEKYFQFFSKSAVSIKNDTLQCLLNNPLDCPLRFYISTSDSDLNKLLFYLYPVTVRPGTDTFFKIKTHLLTSDKIKTSWSTSLGDPERKIVYNKVSLPFCKGKSYKIVQGYNGQHSHNHDYSRFAIDFNLNTNDTICAADDGVVVGVIKDYKIGGNNKRLEDFANFITLYHRHTGLYTQYAHLKYNGSFVKVGDIVNQGQPIGLAGSTGWVTAAHLHFNVLIPIAGKDILKSVPIEFIEHCRGYDLKENDIVKK